MNVFKNICYGLLLLAVLTGCSLSEENDPTPTAPIAGNSPTPFPIITIQNLNLPTSTTVPLITPTLTVPPPLDVSPTPFTLPVGGNTPAPAAVVPTTADTTTNVTSAVNGQVAQGRTGLRLRSLPSENANILQNLNELTPLNIYGRTSDNVWLSVSTNGGANGWVLTAFVDVFVDLNTIPINDIDPAVLANLPTPLPLTPEVANVSVPTGSSGYVIAEGNGLRLRDQPSTNANIIATLPERSSVTIIGRNQDGTWLQVQSDKGTGWVFANYVQSSLDVAALNVPEEAYAPTPAAFVPPTTITAQGAISGVTSNSSKIFLRGQSFGNRPNVFSKVGDSITATGHFLYPFGWGQYNLHNYAYYQEVVNFFLAGSAREGNPFSTGSLAAKPYWTSATVLDPSKAEPPCNAGEMPLVCEYRINRPSLALIMIGTNDIGQNSAGQFQANLQRIVEISQAMGVIPVLSTIPPKNGWDADVALFNQIIITTARGYDVPLWDYYSALLPLPNRGLNEDGVHPAWLGGDYSNYYPSGDFTAENLQYGFVLRNLMALQVLDTIWRQVLAPNLPYRGAVTGDNTVGLTANLLSGVAAVQSNPSLPTPVVPAASGSTTTSSGACPGAPPPRLVVGGLGRVTPGTPNNFRAGPSSASARLGQLPGGAVFTVLEGPVCSDGMTYWKVNYSGQEGWTAEGKGTTYWLEPQ